MFVFLLTVVTLYDIMQEYRRKRCLCSFAVQLRLYRYSSSKREFSADMTAPHSALLCKDFSAKRAAPEPSERRAIMGFYKRAIFLNPVKWLSFFERRQAYFVLQFFKISRYLIRSEKMCDERLLLLYNFLATKPKTSRIFGRALMGFFSVQIFR